jgi:hypothetical protein
MPLDGRSGIARGYVELSGEASRTSVGRVCSGRLHRSCESVEATSRSSGEAWDAYPSVCSSPDDCGRWWRCELAARRALVIFRARAAVIEARSGSWSSPIAR